MRPHRRVNHEGRRIPHRWEFVPVSAQVATRIGPSSPLLHSDSGARAWLQVQKGF
jgi:hypothetical protein